MASEVPMSLGTEGEGTVKVAETPVKVSPVGGDSITAPDQLEE